MRRRWLLTALALACAIGLGAPGAVIAASGGTSIEVLADCNAHSQLTQHYSVTALRQALATMPADLREYSDCFDVIQKELFAQLGTSGSGGSGTTGGSSSGSFLPTPLLVIIILLALAALTFGAIAIRRRSTGEPPAGGPPSGGPPGAAPSDTDPTDPGGSGGAGGPQ